VPVVRLEFTVTAGEQPKRVDVFLASRDPNLSRSAVQKLIDEGRVSVNGSAVRASQRIRPGDRIAWDTYQPPKVDMQPEQVAIEILFEDDVLLVLNKPPGLVVHPSPGHWKGTLMNALLSHTERPGLVHRLDKDTSGVMVIAKNAEAHRRLAAQFADHSITRVYEALVTGIPERKRGLIEMRIGRDSKDPTKFSARTREPQAAVTEYRVTTRFGQLASRVLLYPQTGRTNQLRVHLSEIGHPILGDATYGGTRALAGIPIPRVMLHARMLGFRHPATGNYVEFAHEPPCDMQRVLDGITPDTPMA
jgi:23S rRNA pseudouridine1911/1915/1917 synthase